MFDLLLYASISCQDATKMIGRVEANEDMAEIIKTEIVETLKESTPHCEWDAND
mgnify:CR=1 FL=1|jgi:hypothetical protein